MIEVIGLAGPPGLARATASTVPCPVRPRLRGNGYRTLEIRAEAIIEEDPDLAFFERVVRHYGADPDNFPAPHEGRVILALRPARVVTNG